MLASLVGNGVGLLLIGVCWIAMKHIKGGKKWERGAMRAIIIVMLLGGAALLLTGIGHLVNSGLVLALGLLGGKAELVISTLIFIFLLFEVVMGVWRYPTAKAAWMAVFLAFALTLPLSGGPGTLAAQIRVSATTYAAQIGAKLGV